MAKFFEFLNDKFHYLLRANINKLYLAGAPQRTASIKEQLKTSQADKNLQILITRQAEYKQEAMKLYKSGNQVGAKKHLAQVYFCNNSKNVHCTLPYITVYCIVYNVYNVSFCFLRSINITYIVRLKVLIK